MNADATTWKVAAGAFAALTLAGCSPRTEPIKDVDGPAKAPDAVPQTVDPAAYRGAAIAGQVCAQCHDTTATGATAGQSLSGPSFASVANRPNTTAAGLEAWLTSSHPSMPNYIFDEGTVKDLTAYVMSLRGAS